MSCVVSYNHVLFMFESSGLCGYVKAQRALYKRRVIRCFILLAPPLSASNSNTWRISFVLARDLLGAGIRLSFALLWSS
jgi:hypothetical protein